MTELYFVLQRDAGCTPGTTAAFLAAERCLPLPEAAAAAAKSPGFLLENASLEKAAPFNLRASARGIETILISSRHLKPPPGPLTVSKIKLRPAGFDYTSGALTEHLPYEALRTLALTVTTRIPPPKDPGEAVEKELGGLLAALRGRFFPDGPPEGSEWPESPRPPAPAPETVFRADILARGPLRLSVTQDEQDYSGLGSKKTVSTLENFRTLLNELVSLSFGAAKNPLLAAFLKKEPLYSLKHPSAEIYEKELLWLSTIARD